MSTNSSAFPTMVQNIALDLVFEVMGEGRINRTTEEYHAIARRLPPLKVLHHEVNRQLQTNLKRLADRGLAPHELCIFKAGHKRIVFEPYPRTISIETIRTALNVTGLRKARSH